MAHRKNQNLAHHRLHMRRPKNQTSFENTGAELLFFLISSEASAYQVEACFAKEVPRLELIPRQDLKE
jgi:hypothetical protein